MLIQDNNNLIAKHRKRLVIVISACAAADVDVLTLYSPVKWTRVAFSALSNMFMRVNATLSHLCCIWIYIKAVNMD